MVIQALQRVIVIVTTGVALMALAAPAGAAAPPANDDFASAQAVSVPQQVTGSITGATLQVGEPDPSDEGLAISVWYRFTASVDGPVKIDTCASSVYAQATVYTGAAVAALTEVAHGTGFCDGGVRLHFTAHAGTTYHIAVTGYSGDEGDITLKTATPSPPANDDFADAEAVTLPGEANGPIDDATLQDAEPDAHFEGDAVTVWYGYAAATAGPVKLDTCASTFYAPVAVYTGAGVNDLTEVAVSNGGCDGGGRAYFTAAAGTTYHIAVSGYGDASGQIALRLLRPQPPANDDFANARALRMPEQVTGTSVDATLEAGEPELLDGGDHSVWYKLTLGTSQGVGIDTCGSDRATVLGVYTGATLGSLTEIGTDEESCDDGGGIVDFVTTPDTTYYIAVRSYGDEMGDFKILAGGTHAGPTPPPPPPPPPTCPPAGSPPGAVAYSGTHSGGGSVCLTVLPDFTAVASFHVLDAPGDICHFGFAIDRFPSPLAIASRAFSSTTDALNGSFLTDRGAQGTVTLTRTREGETCTSPTLTWTATTTATPPWAIPAAAPPPPPADTTPPKVRVRGAMFQHPLRANSVVVVVQCPLEACTAAASATVAGVKLSAAPRAIAGGNRRTLRLKLSERARRALGASLRRHRSLRVRVRVRARDGAGNLTKAGRTITLGR